MPIKKTISKDSAETSTTKKVNAYLFFSKAHRAEVTANLQKSADFDQKTAAKQVLCKLGEMWRLLSEEQKSEYFTHFIQIERISTFQRFLFRWKTRAATEISA
jgi:hypothetical protein